MRLSGIWHVFVRSEFPNLKLLLLATPPNALRLLGER